MKTFLTIILSVVISILILLHFVVKKDGEFITLDNIGQIALNEKDKLKIQAFYGNDLEILGSDVIINAGNEFIDLRVGDESRIIINRDAIHINSDNLFINNIKQ